jgi:hypothetical protein
MSEHEHNMDVMDVNNGEKTAEANSAEELKK